MPPAKARQPVPAPEDSRSEASTVRERQIAAAAHARKSKQQNAAAAATASSSISSLHPPNGTQALKDLALVSSAQPPSSSAFPDQHSGGMSWNTAPLALLNSYRLAHALKDTSAAFTSPRSQALLEDRSGRGLGRRSPTMARKREKRRVGREALATSVRKHFNGAAVSETDVVVGLVYRVRNKDKSFRMRSAPGVSKK